jgi:hypothetical protein
MTKQGTSLSIQTFSTLIERNAKYVDKTGIIHRLISSTATAFFFARPRRFGKSLTVTTLDAIFLGKKALFTGLEISKTDYAWPIHPVIRLDMKYAAQENLERSERGLISNIKAVADKYNLELINLNPDDCFKELIQKQLQNGIQI